jgi:RNA recognition motif-containing protein
MPTLLIVDHLPPRFSDEKLADLFRPFGEVVSVRIVRDQHQHSLDFGFVKMADHEGAQRAIEALNGKELGARKVSVSLASGSTSDAGP